MAISLYSFAANTKIKSSEVNSNFSELKSAIDDTSTGHDHDGTDSKQLDWDTCWADAVHTHASAAEGGALYLKRAFAWGIQGTLATGDAQGMRYIVPAGMTTIKVKAYVTSGSGVAIRIDKNGSSLKTLSSIGTSVSSSNVSTGLSENDKLTLDITSAGGTDLWVVLECQQAI